MMIVMKREATEEQIQAVCEAIHEHGMESLVLPGGQRVAVGIPSAIPPELRPVLDQHLSAMDGVDQVIHISRPYKRASRDFHPHDTIVRIGHVEIGGGRFAVMAGPCAVESYEQLSAAARAVKAAGAQVLRAGAYKPRTSPYSFQGLQREGLEILRTVAQEVDILTVSEVIDPRDVEMMSEYVDILQIGARNMQNFALLKAVGRCGKPVLLKRGIAATLEEWLMAAEYILNEGNSRVILCERGIRTFSDHLRFTLDVGAVSVVKELSHLPVIVDPSHAAGIRTKVIPLALAGIAAGADGLIVEVHHDPDKALCDGPQALLPEQFQKLLDEATLVAHAVGRRLARHTYAHSG